MTRTASQTTSTDLFAALLRGEAIAWSAFEMPVEEFLRTCNDESVTGLICERLRSSKDGSEWPRNIREALASEVRALAAGELLHHQELTSVVDVLEAHGLSPIFMKGTALAYSLYDTPSSRPRIDTDLFIRRDQADPIRHAMEGLGYTAPPYCQGDWLFCQFPLVKTAAFGVEHRFDCHWKISTQSTFADVLTFDEIADRTIALPALGTSARTLAPLDALLLACIHPVMHHRSAESLIWLYDIHLLASSLSAPEFERFAEMANAKRVSAICAHQLTAAKTRLGTRIPDAVIRDMTVGRKRELSAVYLRPNRRWLDELTSNLWSLPRWSDRLQLLREVALPDAAYMLRHYGLEKSHLGVALLPLFYVHRLLFGGWKLVVGRK